MQLDTQFAGTAARRPQIVVLDTNAVFDWLVFRDPGIAVLAAAIEARRVRWVATAAMRDECFHVLGRGSLDGWKPDRARLHAAWDSCCMRAEAPEQVSMTQPRLRCSDPQDQMFIDLAAGLPADCLVSKDRAVRRLATPLRPLGVRVLTPAEWTAAEDPSHH